MSDDKGTLINIELIPKELITNVFGPATKSIGEGLGGVANYVMGPLRKLNVVSEKSYQDFVEKVNTKTESIPEENRDISKLGLSLKAVEDSRYQLENENMREYFANLLAGLVDNRKNQNSSPRFSTVLSELTTEEAQLLSRLYEDISTPTLSARVQHSNGDGIDSMQNTLLFRDTEIFGANSLLYTLQSYGLIEIRTSIELKDKKKLDIYEKFETSDYFLELKEGFIRQYELHPFFHNTKYDIESTRGSIVVTELGQKFCSMIFSKKKE